MTTRLIVAFAVSLAAGAFSMAAAAEKDDSIAVTPQHVVDPSILSDGVATAAEAEKKGGLPFEVHGTIGAGIGTNGYRSVFATANIALGEDGEKGNIFLSYENTHWGHR